MELINYFTYLSTFVPSNICVFLSCRPFVVNTTFSTGLVGVEVHEKLYGDQEKDLGLRGELLFKFKRVKEIGNCIGRGKGSHRKQK